MARNRKGLTALTNRNPAGPEDTKDYAGHRAQLKERSLKHDAPGLPDRGILELLLT